METNGVITIEETMKLNLLGAMTDYLGYAVDDDETYVKWVLFVNDVLGAFECPPLEALNDPDKWNKILMLFPIYATRKQFIDKFGEDLLEGFVD